MSTRRLPFSIASPSLSETSGWDPMKFPAPRQCKLDIQPSVVLTIGSIYTRASNPRTTGTVSATSAIGVLGCKSWIEAFVDKWRLWDIVAHDRSCELKKPNVTASKLFQ